MHLSRLSDRRFARAQSVTRFARPWFGTGKEETLTASKIEFSFSLTPVAPFDLGLTAWALRRRAINETDRWDGSRYCRSIAFGKGAIEVTVRQCAPPESPRLRVHVEGIGASSGARAAVTGVLERTLGLRLDLAPFYAMASTDPRLDLLARRFRGMKPPRFPTVFEALLNAVACQQVSLQSGLTQLNHLVHAYGRPVSGAPETGHAFPLPEDLMHADPDALRSLGFSRQKGRSITELSAALVERRFDADRLIELDDNAAAESLRELRGVGRWTAEYVLLRGLGRLQVFPGDDVGARNNLRRWLGQTESLDYDGVGQAVARWHPYGGLIYLHLLLKGLADAGALAGGIKLAPRAHRGSRGDAPESPAAATVPRP